MQISPPGKSFLTKNDAFSSLDAIIALLIGLVAFMPLVVLVSNAGNRVDEYNMQTTRLIEARNEYAAQIIE